MTWLSLADFGDVSRCDLFPPTMEEDLRTTDSETFVHPVLDRRRYISSSFITGAHFRPGIWTVHSLVSSARNTLSLSGLRPARVRRGVYNTNSSDGDSKSGSDLTPRLGN